MTVQLVDDWKHLMFIVTCERRLMALLSIHLSVSCQGITFKRRRCERDLWWAGCQRQQIHSVTMLRVSVNNDRYIAWQTVLVDSRQRSQKVAQRWITREASHYVLRRELRW